MISRRYWMTIGERNTKTMNSERSKKKSEYEIYLETGILGGYMPDEITQRRLDSGKIMPIFRDAVCTAENGRIELRRQMRVRNRIFTVISIFDAGSKKTATDRLKKVIDENLSKGTK